MPRFLPIVVIAVALLCGIDGADAAKRDVKGIELGASADQIVKKAQVACRHNKAGAVSCTDPTDGSEFKVLFSGGDPSRALSVKHTFCSSVSAATVLSGLLRSYGTTKAAAHGVPNGTVFNVTATVQGILNTSDKPCPNGRKSYQFTLSDAALLRM